jgi:hypothetical protein
MDQAARHVESPTQKPQNDQDRKDGPKHSFPGQFQSGTVVL